MAKLNGKERSKLRSSTFGLPSQRKYPMPDAGHAANAKARARQQYNKGHISGSQLRQINSKANGILH